MDLSKIKKYFFKEPLSKYVNCICCGKKLKGKQRKFCSDKCNNDTYRKLNSKKGYWYAKKREIIKLNKMKGGIKKCEKTLIMEQ